MQSFPQGCVVRRTRQYALMTSLCRLLIALYASAASAAEPAELDRDAKLILEQPLPESAYTRPVNCLPLRGYRTVEVLDSSHLLFWDGDRVWLNQLRRSCIGLSDDKLLYFNTSGMSLCAMDQFQAVDRATGAGTVTRCSLQRFEPVTPAQAKQLRDWLAKLARKTTAAPPTPPPEAAGRG
jgi:hypothetical protein